MTNGAAPHLSAGLGPCVVQSHWSSKNIVRRDIANAQCQYVRTEIDLYSAAIVQIPSSRLDLTDSGFDCSFSESSHTRFRT